MREGDITSGEGGRKGGREGECVNEGGERVVVKKTFRVMTKRKWEGRREGFKVSTTREEAQGPGRPSTRGRFSESWKRLSSRQGSTKRSGLASQQAVRGGWVQGRDRWWKRGRVENEGMGSHRDGQRGAGKILASAGGNLKVPLCLGGCQWKVSG
ncbi:unnamed protein product [Leuciscus chuanchicus]